MNVVAHARAIPRVVVSACGSSGEHAQQCDCQSQIIGGDKFCKYC